MITQNIINVYKLSIQKGLKQLEDISNLELRQKVEDSLLIDEKKANETN